MADELKPPGKDEIERTYGLKVEQYDPDALYLQVRTVYNRLYNVEATGTDEGGYVFRIDCLDVPEFTGGDGYYDAQTVLDKALRNVVEYDEFYERDAGAAMNAWRSWQRDSVLSGWRSGLPQLQDTE